MDNSSQDWIWFEMMMKERKSLRTGHQSGIYKNLEETIEAAQDEWQR